MRLCDDELIVMKHTARVVTVCRKLLPLTWVLLFVARSSGGGTIKSTHTHTQRIHCREASWYRAQPSLVG